MMTTRTRARSGGFFLALATLLVLAGCGPEAPGTAASTPTPALQGTLLGGSATPNFSLPDQNGHVITLASLAGHPVVFTFLDSTCTEQCPLTALALNQTQQLLGPLSSQVEWVALSLDPWHDTPASAKAFLAENKVTLPIHWLLGTEAQLRPLWKAFHMEVEYTPTDIIHTVGLYILDARGREQVWLDAGFDPMMLNQDLRVMLAS